MSQKEEEEKHPCSGLRFNKKATRPEDPALLPCPTNAKYQEDGKWYCLTHLPSHKKARETDRWIDQDESLRIKKESELKNHARWAEWTLLCMLECLWALDIGAAIRYRNDYLRKYGGDFSVTVTWRRGDLEKD